MLGISLIPVSTIWANTRITKGDLAFFSAGSLSQIDPNALFGELRLASKALGANNEFDAPAVNSALKPGWSQQGTISYSYDVPGQRMLILDSWSGKGTIATAFFVNPGSVQIEAKVSGLGNLYLENENLQSRNVRFSNNSVIFYSDSNQIASKIVLLSPSTYLIRLRYSGSIVSLWYKAENAAVWEFIGSESLAAQNLRIGLGDSTTYIKSSNFYIYHLRVAPYFAQGSFTSAAIDLQGIPTTVGKISWDQDLPAGTQMDIQTSTSVDGDNWSAWSTAYPDNFGSVISSIPRRYIRVAATLRSNTDLSLTPILREVTIDYPPAEPLTPVFGSSSHPQNNWGSAPVLNLQWTPAPGSPAPASAYAIWHVSPGSPNPVTQMVRAPAGNAVYTYLRSLTLTPQGLNQVYVNTIGDEFSGGITSTASVFEFSYDGTPPLQPTIISPTHPELIFTNNHSPVFELSAQDTLSGIAGYSVVLDTAPVSYPDGEITHTNNQVRYSNLDNGTYYLHAAAVDAAGNVSTSSHYGFRVDFTGDLLGADFVKALPNPVRSNTALLEYELAADATDVRLEFFSPSGQKVHQADGSKQVGKNHYRWDVNGLANGVYFFKVTAKSSANGRTYQVIKKIAILR